MYGMEIKLLGRGITNNMGDFFKWELRKTKAFNGVILILSLLLIFSLVTIQGVREMAMDYARAGVKIDQDTFSELYYYFGFTPTGRSSSGLSITVENLSVDFLIPILLGSFFAGKFYEDRKRKRNHLIINEVGTVRYYLYYIIKVFLLVSVLLFAAFILQFVLGFVIDQFLKPLGYANSFSLSLLIEVVKSALRIALFYSYSVVIALSLSALIPAIGRFVYLIPLIITLVSEIFSKPTQPLKEAFITSGNAIQLKSTYYSFILLMTAIVGTLFLLITLFRKDEI